VLLTYQLRKEVAKIAAQDKVCETVKYKFGDETDKDKHGCRVGT